MVVDGMLLMMAVTFLAWLRPLPRVLPFPSPFRYFMKVLRLVLSRLFPWDANAVGCGCRRDGRVCLECLVLDWVWTILVLYVVGLWLMRVSGVF